MTTSFDPVPRDPAALARATEAPADLLPRYLTRLGVTMTPDEARRRAAAGAESAIGLLDELLAAHVDALPFENLDVLVGRPVSRQLPDVAAKMLDGRRGGYCHEHASLVRGVLAELGLPARPVLARITMRPGPPGPLSHGATLADVGGLWVLVDPGFGAGTPEVALPLVDDGPVRTVDRGQFRLARAAEALAPERLADHDWVVQTRADESGEFRSVYGFADVAREESDLGVAHWFASTSPSSRFVGHLTVARGLRDGGKVTLDHGRARVVDRSGPEATRREWELGSAGELAAFLGDLAGLRVDEGLAAEVWQHVRA